MSTPPWSNLAGVKYSYGYVITLYRVVEIESKLIELDLMLLKQVRLYSYCFYHNIVSVEYTIYTVIQIIIYIDIHVLLTNLNWRTTEQFKMSTVNCYTHKHSLSCNSSGQIPLFIRT